MDAILKFEDPKNSYSYFVYAENLSTEVEKDPACVIRCQYNDKAEFNDGRVCFSSSTLTIDDNIDIYIVNKYGHLTDVITPRTIVAYLNQISMYGIEVFLENYKKALVEFMEILSKQVACVDDDQRKTSMKSTLSHVSSLIFNIAMHVKDKGGFYYWRQKRIASSI